MLSYARNLYDVSFNVVFVSVEILLQVILHENIIAKGTTKTSLMKWCYFIIRLLIYDSNFASIFVKLR